MDEVLRGVAEWRVRDPPERHSRSPPEFQLAQSSWSEMSSGGEVALDALSPRGCEGVSSVSLPSRGGLDFEGVSEGRGLLELLLAGVLDLFDDEPGSFLGSRLQVPSSTLSRSGVLFCTGIVMPRSPPPRGVPI